MLTLARGAANDAQWSIAYQIASQVDDAYPAGTDVSARPYGERDDYTSLAWLAGTTALQQLGRPADAARMFDRYGRAARSPQTRAKGFYWAGARRRAAPASRPQANAWLEQAAASPDQFYGQLALERLGRPAPPPLAAPSRCRRRRSAPPSPPGRSPRRPALLGMIGRWSDQSLFVRALAEQAETEQRPGRSPPSSAGRSAASISASGSAREARNKGAELLRPRPASPKCSIPPAYRHHWALAHGITRQESSFDRAAVSHAGARGLMQLMPGTAREQAGKLGLPYDLGRLTARSGLQHHARHRAISQRLLDQWGGNAPLAVASYNAGAGNVRSGSRERRSAHAGADIVRWIEAIPFSETRNYVQRVLENAVVYDAIRAQRSGGRPNRLSYYLGKSGRADRRHANSSGSRELGWMPDSSGMTTRHDRPPNYITPDGYRRLREEYEALFARRAAEAGRDDRLGGGNGDRSENGDYHLRPQAAARDRPADQLPVAADEGRQGHRSPGPARRGRVWFGATVTLADEDDKRADVTLVGEDEADAGARPDQLELADRPRHPRRRGRRSAPGDPAGRRAGAGDRRDRLSTLDVTLNLLQGPAVARESASSWMLKPVAGVTSSAERLAGQLSISGSASGGFIGQAASSASATAVSAAIRAAFLLLPSITVQGAQRVSVRSNMS